MNTERLMSRRLRNDIAAVMFALFIAGFVTHLYLFEKYFYLRAASQPNPALGLVYPLNNHGAYAYLSATESTGMALLWRICFAAFLAAVVVTPKDWVKKDNMQPWITHASAGGRWSTDLGTPSRRHKILLAVSLVGFVALFRLAGPAVVEDLVRRGLILN
jgi:hypothetical protein